VNKSDVVDVLSMVAAGDRRTVGDADVEMWFLVMGDVPKDFALSAIVAHRRDFPGIWMEPGHIVDRWRTHQRDKTQRTANVMSIETADNDVTIERRELSTGDERFRFFAESESGHAQCGLWRSTRGEAVRDGINWHRRTA